MSASVDEQKWRKLSDSSPCRKLFTASRNSAIRPASSGGAVLAISSISSSMPSGSVPSCSGAVRTMSTMRAQASSMVSARRISCSDRVTRSTHHKHLTLLLSRPETVSQLTSQSEIRPCSRVSDNRRAGSGQSMTCAEQQRLRSQCRRATEGASASYRSGVLGSRRPVLDLLGLAHGFHRLVDGQQHCRLERTQCAAPADRQCN